MTAVSRTTVEASAQEVWAVLADGWSYAAWVVGASRVRDVDRSWPQVGARVHHSIGAWPVLVHDRTTVIQAQPASVLELDVAVWFFGRGVVRFDVEPLTDATCRVIMREHMVGGLLSIPPSVTVDPLLAHRNNETLRRLAALTRGRHEQRERR